MCSSASRPQTRCARSATGKRSSFGSLSSYVKIVEEPRRRSHFLLQLDEHPLGAEDVGDFAVRVKDVAKFSRSGGADFEARRVSAHARALDAEMTFLHHALAPRAIAEIGHVGIEPLLRNLGLGEVETPRPIRAGGFAVAAADAPVVIDHGDAVFLLPRGVDGANLHAGRVLALLALHRHVEEPFLGHLLEIVIAVSYTH